jgi:IQ calmodulin-binding motif
MSDIKILAVTRIQKIYRGHYTRSHRDDIEDLCLFRKRIRGEIRNCEINCFEGTRVSPLINNRSHLKRFEEWKHQSASKIQRAFKVFLARRNALNKRRLTATINLQCFARKIIAKRKILSLRESRMIFARYQGARLVQSAFRSLLARRRMAKRRYQAQSLAARVIQSSYRSYTAIALVKVIKEKSRRFHGAIALQCFMRQRIAYSRVDALATYRLLYSLSIYSSVIQALVRGFLVRLTLYKTPSIKRPQETPAGKHLQVNLVTRLDGSAAKLQHDGSMVEDKRNLPRLSSEPSVTTPTVDGLRTRIVRRPTQALVVTALTSAILSTAPLANVLNVLTLLFNLVLDDCFNKVDEGSGVTVLQLASQRGLLDVVRLLLRSGDSKKAEEDTIHEGVITAMHKACRPTDPASQALPVVYLLLGARPLSPPARLPNNFILKTMQTITWRPSMCGAVIPYYICILLIFCKHHSQYYIRHRRNNWWQLVAHSY